MVRGSEGVGAGLTGGGGVGSGPAMGLGGSELPPPPPQAVKTATAANTRGRDVICTSASGRALRRPCFGSRLGRWAGRSLPAANSFLGILMVGKRTG